MDSTIFGTMGISISYNKWFDVITTLPGEGYHNQIVWVRREDGTIGECIWDDDVEGFIRSIWDDRIGGFTNSGLLEDHVIEWADGLDWEGELFGEKF